MQNKASIFARFLMAFALMLIQQAAFAQTEMRWDTHGVGFTVPSNFKVSANNAEEYTAENDNLVLSIAPIQDENLTKENMAEVVLAMAEEMKYDAVDEGEEVNIHDFTGYFIKGRKDGVNAVVMALLDKESSTNLIVVIVYAEESFDDAVAIINSFVAYD